MPGLRARESDAEADSSVALPGGWRAGPAQRRRNSGAVLGREHRREALARRRQALGLGGAASVAAGRRWCPLLGSPLTRGSCSPWGRARHCERGARLTSVVCARVCARVCCGRPAGGPPSLQFTFAVFGAVGHAPRRPWPTSPHSRQKKERRQTPVFVLQVLALRAELPAPRAPAAVPARASRRTPAARAQPPARQGAAFVRRDRRLRGRARAAPPRAPHAARCSARAAGRRPPPASGGHTAAAAGASPAAAAGQGRA